MQPATNTQVATPTAFPAPGAFAVTQRVTLLSNTPGATIHYTMDGSTPTSASLVFDPYVLPVLDATEDPAGGTSTYTLKALALKDGLQASDVATFAYTILRRPKDQYTVKELQPGLLTILDFDDTKMYVVIGTQRALFIDAGLGSGDVRSLVEELVGDRPLDVVITHAHPDHIALMGQFQGSYNVYMNHIDLPQLNMFIERLNYKIDPAQVIDLREGHVFDLGNIKFRVYEVPGHSAGSIVLFDEASGLLIAGDAVGSNRPTITDSLWMQFPGMSKIDMYLSALQVFRAKVAGKIKVIYGGHNDAPIYGEEYLDNLQLAAQTLVDQGEQVLVPSLRPTDKWQVVVGDRLTDPNWVAINVSKEACLTTPHDQIATLSNVQVGQSFLEPGFNPTHFTYRASVGSSVESTHLTVTATSTRHQSLTLNGAPAKSGTAQTVPLKPGDNPFTLTVTSPDGSTANTYTLTINRSAA